MRANILYRKIQRGEERQVFDLVKTGFDEYVLPDVTEEGAKEFLRAAREMIYDRPAGHFILVAALEMEIIGMIDVKNNCHIFLFFVAKTFQRKGAGRDLLQQAVAECVAKAPAVLEIDVNSSLFAVQIYRKLGFTESNHEQLANGIRFVPMIKSLRYR